MFVLGSMFVNIEAPYSPRDLAINNAAPNGGTALYLHIMPADTYSVVLIQQEH